MKNDQALYDILDHILFQMKELREAVDRLESRTEKKDGKDPDTEEEENAVEESKEEVTQEEIPDAGEDETKVDDDIAYRLRGLNIGIVSRSAIRTVGDEVLPIGFGYYGNTYTSSKGNVWDMTRPPPEECWKCGGPHWRKDCPNYRPRPLFD